MEIYQVQVNPLKCGWIEIGTYSTREKAEEILAASKKRNNGNPDFEHRIIAIHVDR